MGKINFTYRTDINIIKSIKIQAIRMDINANEIIDLAIKYYLAKEYDIYIVEIEE